MGFIQNFTTLIRDTLNLNEHIDNYTGIWYTIYVKKPIDTTEFLSRAAEGLAL